MVVSPQSFWDVICHAPHLWVALLGNFAKKSIRVIAPGDDKPGMEVGGQVSSLCVNMPENALPASSKTQALAGGREELNIKKSLRHQFLEAVDVLHRKVENGEAIRSAQGQAIDLNLHQGCIVVAIQKRVIYPSNEIWIDQVGYLSPVKPKRLEGEDFYGGSLVLEYRHSGFEAV